MSESTWQKKGEWSLLLPLSPTEPLVRKRLLPPSLHIRTINQFSITLLSLFGSISVSAASQGRSGASPRLRVRLRESQDGLIGTSRATGHSEAPRRRNNYIFPPTAIAAFAFTALPPTANCEKANTIRARQRSRKVSPLPPWKT